MEKFCLKIEIMPDGSRLRYGQSFRGTVIDFVSLPVSRSAQATFVTMEKYPGDKRLEITRAQVADTLRTWRHQAIDVLVVDHRKAIQEITLPSGIVLNRNSHVLLLTKAFHQWQRGETILADDDALALKVWIADRLPFGMDAVEAIKDMQVFEGLEEV